MPSVKYDTSMTDEWRLAFRPRTRGLVSDWADRHRVLPPDSAEPGRWRTSRIPYSREMMNIFTDPRIREFVFVKSSRVGGTEIVNNFIGYAIDEEPGNLLYVYPTEPDAKEECTERIVPLIEDSDRLSKHIPYGGWWTQTQINLDSMIIKFGWATSDRRLIRITCRYVFFDELDNCDAQSGKLGDTYSLAEKRVTTYKKTGRSKVGVVSSVTRPEAATWLRWCASDQRYYHVPCPKCGLYQPLVFDRIRVPKDERDPSRIVILDLAWYQCAGCDAQLKDGEHKEWMVARGVWLKRGQYIAHKFPIGDPEIEERSQVCYRGDDKWTPKVNGEGPLSQVAGFHIWAAYSPWRTWSDIIAEYFDCHGNRQKMIQFYNQVLGLVWEEVENTTSTSTMRQRSVAGLDRGIVNGAATVITVGVDLQKTRLYFVTDAWGVEFENWVIDHGWYSVQSDQETILAPLERWYNDHFRTPKYFRLDGTPMRIRIGLVDSGDGAVTRQVYEFCRTHQGLYACKGDEWKGAEYVKKAAMEPRRKPGEVRHPQSVRQLWLVNTDRCKETLYSMANKQGEGPGTMHLCNDVGDDFVEQFTSEHKVFDVQKKKMLWKTKTVGRANHMLDAKVYSFAGAEMIGALSQRGKASLIEQQQAKKNERNAVRDVLSRYSHSMI